MASRVLSQRRLILDVVVLGVAGAMAAQLFTLALKGASALFLGFLAGYRPPGLPEEGGLPELIGPHGLWLVPVVTALGGLLVGILATRLAPEAEGHGTDTAVRAFHRTQGLIGARVAPVKIVASALTIGSGGSAGREGPVALIGGAIGSWYASLTNRTDHDRRLLMLAGMAAGLAAIFRSPIGTALFVIEVLYADMEFESGALLYTMLASIVAYAVNGVVVGWQPLFRVPAGIAVARPIDNVWYVVLGGVAGVLATVLPVLFYKVRDAFRALPVRAELRPAIGGLLMGLLALAVPQVISGGYGWMQEAIDGHLTMGVLLVLVLAKPVATILTVASGGSGGVFAPTLFVGAMLGGLLAALTHQPPAPYVVVGMAAVFSGAAHVPIATMMMVTEMTGGYTLLVPAALAVMVSYLVQRRLSAHLKYKSMYEAQVATRGDSPAHHSEHLRIALRILREKKVLNPQDVGQLDLMSLLQSGIPVELPGDRRLTVGVLRADSALVKKPLGSGDGVLSADTSVIGVMRGEHMLGPRPDMALEAGDRLVLLTTPAETERLRAHLDKW